MHKKTSVFCVGKGAQHQHEDRSCGNQVRALGPATLHPAPGLRFPEARARKTKPRHRYNCK